MAKASSKTKKHNPFKIKIKSQTISLSGPSSTKVQVGSYEGRQCHEPSPQETPKCHPQAIEIPVAYFVNYERDFKSYAVKEYDAHQETARKSHNEALREAVRKAS